MITYTKYAPPEVGVDQADIKVRARSEQRYWPISDSPSRGPIEWQGQWRSLLFI